MTFEPVWVSSIEHLETFEQTYRRTPSLLRLFGAYDLPDGFPYVRSIMCIPWRTPLVMFASGRLDVQKDAMTFQSRQWHVPLSVLRNLSTDLEFTLAPDDIESIEPYEFASPVMRYFNLPFVRVRTSKGERLADFLLCVGGTGLFMRKIRKRNEEFVADIVQAFPTVATTSPKSSSA